MHRWRTFAKEWCFSSFQKKLDLMMNLVDKRYFLAERAAKGISYMIRIYNLRFCMRTGEKKGTKREHSLLKSWQVPSLLLAL
jgi:hypothetical protein